MTVVRLQFGDSSPSAELVPSTRQASATWELHDLRYPASATEYTVATGSATLDSYDQTLTAATSAGPGEANPSLIQVGTTTGIVAGSTYEISDDHGSELIVADGVTASTSVRTATPLIGTYTATRNAQLRGITLTATFASSVASDSERMENDDPLRIVWILADGTRVQQQVRLYRDVATDSDLASAATEIQSLFPDVGTRVEHQGKTTLRRLIASMASQLEAMERARGEEPYLRLVGDERHWALVWFTLQHLAAQGNQPGNPEDPSLWLDYCEGSFNRYWHGMTTGAGGRETARMVRGTGEATGATDAKHTTTIRGL